MADSDHHQVIPPQIDDISLELVGEAGLRMTFATSGVATAQAVGKRSTTAPMPKK